MWKPKFSLTQAQIDPVDQYQSQLDLNQPVFSSEMSDINLVVWVIQSKGQNYNAKHGNSNNEQLSSSQFHGRDQDQSLSVITVELNWKN